MRSNNRDISDSTLNFSVGGVSKEPTMTPEGVRSLSNTRATGGDYLIQKDSLNKLNNRLIKRTIAKKLPSVVGKHPGAAVAPGVRKNHREDED